MLKLVFSVITTELMLAAANQLAVASLLVVSSLLVGASLLVAAKLHVSLLAVASQAVDVNLLAVTPVAANRRSAARFVLGLQSFTKQRWPDEHNVAAVSQLVDASQLADVSQPVVVSQLVVASQLVSQLVVASQPADVSQPVVVSHLVESKSA